MNVEKLPEETEEQYILRVYKLKDICGLTWYDIAEILNTNLKQQKDESTYRKSIKRLLEDFQNIEVVKTTEDTMVDTELEKLNTIKKEKMKLSDYVIQNNALLRRISREETLKDIAKDAVDKISKNNLILNIPKLNDENEETTAILELSDWHYGIEINNYYNKYNPEIAKDRISRLCAEVCRFLEEHSNIKILHIFNLGDLISGRIHNTIRINNRIDVITQTIEVSELLAQFINEVSRYVNIEYCDTSDNHSRIEPVKENSLDMESLTRIVTWYLIERFKNSDRVNIITNEYSDDIISTKIFDFKVGGVHGHKDRPNNVVENLTLMTKKPYDLICTAHLHHFSANEQNECIVVSNSSLMGTDDYAQSLRCTAHSAQTLIVITPDNACKEIIRFELD